jgi:hypothetical protein
MYAPAIGAIIAGAAGAACKLYDNGVDVAGWPDGSWQLEGSKVLLTVFMLLFLMGGWAVTLLFAIYTIICNLQKSADTAFWQVAGVIPVISAASLLASGSLPTVADVCLAGCGATLVYVEAALYPEEMSWKKWVGRALITVAAALISVIGLRAGWPSWISPLAAWTAGYNFLSVAWPAPLDPTGTASPAAPDIP